MLCLFTQWGNLNKSVHIGRAKNVRCCAPGFLSWKLMCECVHRWQTAKKASVPSLLCPEGLLHIFLWSSDPRPLSKGNEQMWLHDLRAVVWRLFYEWAERLKGRAVSAGTAPCLSANTQHPWETQSLPEKEGHFSVLWVRQKTVSQAALREEPCIITVFSPFSSLFCKHAFVKDLSGISLHPEALSQRK